MGDFDLVRTFGQIPMRRSRRMDKTAPHPMLQELMVARVNAGISLKELGEISGVSHRTIEKMMQRGIGFYCNVEAIANALGYELTLTKRPSAQKEPK